MNRLYCFNIILFISTLSLLQAQTKDKIRTQVVAIKSNPSYLWGEGVGKTLKVARDVARSDIANGIATTVESTAEYQIRENSEWGYSEDFTLAVQTYSSATLSQLNEIIEKDEPGEAKVLLYVPKSEVYKVFSRRKSKIIEYIREAETAEKNNQIADAIRGFYWAQVLLRSLPNPSEMNYTDRDGKTHVLIQWLTRQLVRIFSGIRISILELDQDRDKQIVYLKIDYRGNPVVNFDYRYRSGMEWSGQISAKDGRGYAWLHPNENIADLTVQAEYVFDGLAECDEELKNVLERLETVPYPLSRYANIPREDTGRKVNIFWGEREDEKGNVRDVCFQNRADSVSYTNVMHDIERAVVSREYESVKGYFNSEGFDMFISLISYGHAELYGRAAYQWERSHEGIICRSLPLIFTFSRGQSFVEDVVVEFDHDGLICNLSFGLSKRTLKDIEAHDRWPAESRVAIVRFLEHYKTAYALKRIDYISSVFSDDALIITGTVLKRQERVDATTIQLRENIRLREQTKEEYLKRLKLCFAKNEYINIQFTESHIRRGDISCGELYGIQIKQDYYSATYGDSGYLFLMVDLNDEDAPMIHVRAWQPEKDLEFGQIGLEHFTVK